MFDENDRRTRTNTGDVSSDRETEPVHVHDRPPLGKEFNKQVQNPTYSVCNSMCNCYETKYFQGQFTVISEYCKLESKQNRPHICILSEKGG